MLFHWSLSEHCCDDGLDEAVNSQNMIPVCLLNISILQCQHGSVSAFSIFCFCLCVNQHAHASLAHDCGVAQ